MLDIFVWYCTSQVMKAFHLSHCFAIDAYFAFGSGLLLTNTNYHEFCFLDVDTEAFLLAFMYYDVEQAL